jgi:hypothetical protein
VTTSPTHLPETTSERAFGMALSEDGAEIITSRKSSETFPSHQYFGSSNNFRKRFGSSF